MASGRGDVKDERGEGWTTVSYVLFVIREVLWEFLHIVTRIISRYNRGLLSFREEEMVVFLRL